MESTTTTTTTSSSSSSSSSETESLVFLAKRRTTKKKKMKKSQQQLKNQRSMEEEWCSWPKRKSSSGVTLEGYLEAGADHGSMISEVGVAADEEQLQLVVGRTKSLTDEDLDELKGCLDLGFGFSYDEIPELCNTLPALELCYSMNQKFLDDQQRQTPQDSSSSGEAEPPEPTAAAAPVANWKFSNPGDSPEEVKARLKYWAQAVACTVRLCS